MNQWKNNLSERINQNHFMQAIFTICQVKGEFIGACFVVTTNV